jgi:hypothetical protein
LARELRTGAITIGEYDIANSELASAKSRMTAPNDIPPAEVPLQKDEEADWSPTSVLDTLPSAEDRIYDARERAAGEGRR